MNNEDYKNFVLDKWSSTISLYESLKEGAEPDAEDKENSYFNEEVIHMIQSTENRLRSPNFEGLVPFYKYEELFHKTNEKQEKLYDNDGCPIYEPKFILNPEFIFWLKKLDEHDSKKAILPKIYNECLKKEGIEDRIADDDLAFAKKKE